MATDEDSLDAADVDGFIFNPPSFLLCPITHELFIDPVVNAAGHTYERSAITEVLQRWPEDPRDPVSRASLRGQMGLMPVLAVKGQALEYRERAARKCVSMACTCGYEEALRYLGRAGELLDGVDLKVDGLSNDCLACLRSSSNYNGKEEVIMQLFANGLSESGQHSQAATIYSQALRKQQVQLLKLCTASLATEDNTSDELGIEGIANILESTMLLNSNFHKTLRETGMDDSTITKLYRELLQRSPTGRELQEVRTKFQVTSKENLEQASALQDLEKERSSLTTMFQQAEAQSEKLRRDKDTLSTELEGLQADYKRLSEELQQLQTQLPMTGTSKLAKIKEWLATPAQAQQKSRESPPMNAASLEDLSSWNTHSRHVVGPDRLTVTSGLNHGSFETSMVGSRCASEGVQDCYYFEVELIDFIRTCFFVGFGPKNFDLESSPGKLAGSYSYDAREGQRLTNGIRYRERGVKARQGDVIGAGLVANTGRIFFTVNGRLQQPGFASVPLSPKLYPTLGSTFSASRIRFNFGQEPFLFDVRSVTKNLSLVAEGEKTEASQVWNAFLSRNFE